MQYHIVLGQKFSLILQQYLEHQGLGDTHEVVTLLDDLSFGPLRDENLPFSALRIQFWSDLAQNNKELSFITIDDLERLLFVRKALIDNIDNTLVYWFDPSANGLMHYYLLLHYFKNNNGQLYTININGLPFLDSDLKLFYPSYLYQIPTKEIRKTLKLARLISNSELEADIDEFKFYQNSSNHFRQLRSSKSIHALDYNDWGTILFDSIPNEPIKLSKLLALWLKGYDTMYASYVYKFYMNDLVLKGLISIENNTVTKL